MKKIFIVLTALVLGSCEKVIDIDLENAEPKLVIEANLSNQNEPMVVAISNTVQFSASNKFNGLSGALVELKDEAGATQKLSETEAGIYKSEALKGIEGTKYTLTVNYQGKVYTAQSTMPKAVILEDVLTSYGNIGPQGEGFQITPVYTDPKTTGNNYRFIQYRNGEVDKTYIVSNDFVRNGLLNIRPIISPTFELKEGENFTLEMRCIDLATYEYFYTLAAVAGNGPGGGTTPTNPPNNWNNGALGYFSAHTTQKISKVLKK
jgi:hypothetical protein